MMIDQINAITDTTEKLKLVTEMLNQLAEITEHFSLKPLTDAYKKYLAEYTTAYASTNWTACNAAWLAIGVEQGKLPTNHALSNCH